MKDFKPLLAADAIKHGVDKLRFPLLGSTKLDGIRCIIHPTLGPVTRKLEPIRNIELSKRLRKYPTWLDGELLAGPPNAIDAMQRTSSAVMAYENPIDDVVFYAFDTVSERPFVRRLEETHAHKPRDFQIIEHFWVKDADELVQLEERYVLEGYEGIMLRDPDGRYKFGRSTGNEGILYKLKRFEDAEGVIVGFEEKMHNTNAQERDELGHAKRSSAQDGLVGKGTLGALILKIEGWASDTLRVGTGVGLNDKLRAEIWANRKKYLGRVVTYKFQRVGSKDKPRIPLFKGFRED
jgi:DNA ligase-1